MQADLGLCWSFIPHCSKSWKQSEIGSWLGFESQFYIGSLLKRHHHNSTKKKRFMLPWVNNWISSCGFRALRTCAKPDKSITMHAQQPSGRIWLGLNIHGYEIRKALTRHRRCAGLSVAGQLGPKSSRPLSQLGPGSTRPESTRPEVFSEGSGTYIYCIWCVLYMYTLSEL